MSHRPSRVSRRLFDNTPNPTQNLLKMCGITTDDKKSNVSCTEFTEGGFGKIYKCKLTCGNIETISDVIKKEYKSTGTDNRNDNELEFMKTYCSTHDYEEFFAQLLFWNIKDNNIIELGIKKYYSSLQHPDISKRHDYVINNIDIIHKKVVDCINKLHEIGYVHLDIKPDNILIDYDETTKTINDVVLSDFGLIRKIDDSSLIYTENGTPWIWLPKPSRHVNDPKKFAIFRDNWAWAMSLCYLLSYFNNDSFDWLKSLHEGDPYIQWSAHLRTTEFIHGRSRRKQGQELLKINDTHKEINKFINAIISECIVYYKQSAGGANKIIKYNDKAYKVYKNKANEKYINVNKTKLFLSSIRRQYRYIKN